MGIHIFRSFCFLVSVVLERHLTHRSHKYHSLFALWGAIIELCPGLDSKYLIIFFKSSLSTLK
jgi:hypothetical protein